MPDLIIADISEETSRIKRFDLVSADGSDLPDWSAGAHIDIKTKAGVRSYSLISWQAEKTLHYQIAVQLEDSGEGGSQAMHSLNVGDTVSASAPLNDFSLVENNRPVLLLAGGIGVTPLISMATTLAAKDASFNFYYAGRTRSEMAYVDELKAMHAEQFNSYFDDVNCIDMAELMVDKQDHTLYICGPKGMIEAARTAAEAQGIVASQIHVELFNTTVPATGDTAFEVEIADSGQVINVDADQTIIEALEKAGLDLMYDCQRGDCGICQTDVVSGTPDHRDVVLSQTEKDSGKVMQICVSRAKSKRLVLAL